MADAPGVRETVVIDFTATLLGVLGHTDGEFTALGYEDSAGDFHTAVVPPADAPGVTDQIPATVNTFFSVNPVRGPSRRNCGRGKETDVTRLAALWADLDLKPSGCPSLDVARAIIADLSIILGTRPSAIVESGHGLHAYWPITDGHITDGHIRAARALLKRWGRLVAAVAEKLGVAVDNVFDLPRMMRVPGTLNNKHTNGQGPLPVTARADTGGPLTITEVDERLCEVGILEEPDDTTADTDPVSTPDEWQFAEHTCGYVAAILTSLPTDGPPENPKPGKGKGRHQWAASQAVKLTCALRCGCISETDWRTAQNLLEKRLQELRAATGQAVPKYEISGLFKLGKQRASRKTDQQCRAELGGHTHTPPEPPPDIDDHYAGEYRGGGDHTGDQAEGEPTTWEPVDLGPWLDEQAQQVPEPSLGLARSDGLRVIYPGREHAVLGETESGKTWLALGCAAAELDRGHRVVYIHYEEGDPASTIERLLLLGVDPTMIAQRLRFVAPARPVRAGWLAALLDPPPTLVIHDGVNEAMALIGADIMAADGAATFRRQLITPFLRAGAASIACDHLPKEREGRSRDAYGSVHKGNALDGARIVLETTAPFGRQMRGASYVFVTKDRPGRLRCHGRRSKLPAKTFMGTLVVDDATGGPDFGMWFFAPKDEDINAAERNPATELADTVYDVIAALPERTVSSFRELCAQTRKAGHCFRTTKIRDAVDDLIVAERLIEVIGNRGAKGYQAVVTVSQEEPL